MRAALAVLVTMLAAATAAAADRTFEQRVPADPDGRVSISNVSGSVRVTGWDRKEVEVKATLGSDVTRVEVTTEKGRTAIRVVLPRNTRRGDADMTVFLPRDSDLEVSLVSADLTSRDMRGEQRLRTVSGDVSAELGQGDVEIKTVSGDATLRGSDKPLDLRITTVSGDVTVENAAGELDATSVSGDIRAELDPARSVHVRTTSGDFVFKGRLERDASLNAESISGELYIEAAAKQGYRYEVSSFSGGIENCFGADAERTSRYGPGSRLSGARGAGQGEIRLKTMSGDIDLCD
jgi:DUF4097 and DUF4098 domain-containing protein YvlB